MRVLWIDKDRRRRRGLGRAAGVLARGMLGDVRVMYTGVEGDHKDDSDDSDDSDDDDGREMVGVTERGRGRDTSACYCVIGLQELCGMY
jgi:hypothetical protein